MGKQGKTIKPLIYGRVLVKVNVTQEISLCSIVKGSFHKYQIGEHCHINIGASNMYFICFK